MEKKKQYEGCIGDLSTHKVRIGQVWRNRLDPTETKEILDIRTQHAVNVKFCYQTFGTIRYSRCDISEKYVDPWISLHDYLLIKEEKQEEKKKKLKS